VREKRTLALGQWYHVNKVPLYCSRIHKNESSNEAFFEAQSHSTSH